jgi:hypothetical protein
MVSCATKPTFREKGQQLISVVAQIKTRGSGNHDDEESLAYQFIHEAYRYMNYAQFSQSRIYRPFIYDSTHNHFHWPIRTPGVLPTCIW